MNSSSYEVKSQLNSEHKTILCIDDEKNIVNALKRQFRNTQYKVITTTEPLSAMELLKQSDISVVICDYRMPQITGLELLANIKKEHPMIVRILLTGESDMSLVVRAINEGAIFKFISKPWDKNKLASIIDEAYELYSSRRKKEQFTKELASSNNELSTHNRQLVKEVVSKSDELHKVSSYDEVTNLPNRALLLKNLTEILSSRKATTDNLSVLAIGLDKLKRVTDGSISTLHNDVLKSTAKRLNSHARSCDIVGMISDERFCIILNAMIEPAILDEIAQRILRFLSEPLLIDGKEVYLTASIGISSCPDHGNTAQNLINHAEAAMNIAKGYGGDQYCHYSSEYQVITNARISLESELRHAVVNEEFELYFQPRVCCNSERIIAAEGLIRWIHPERGLIPPDQFIPILEETGLINSVSRWVIAEACQLLEKWKSQGAPDIKLSVNLTSTLFSDPAVEDLIKTLENNYCRESVIKNLELEITEGILMEDIAHTQHLLNLFCEMGISLAIDDFGTGYSSLNYLVKFPVNYLKIDKSFIDELGENQDVNSVVRMMILLAQGLRMRVVAEGIETTKQADALRVLGCDELQGYLYSKPLPEHDFLDLLNSNRSINIMTSSKKIHSSPEKTIEPDGIIA